VQNTIRASDRERHTQESETPRNALVVPTRLFPYQCFEHEVRVAARPKHDEDNNYHNEKADVEYATSNFESVEEFAKPKIEHERDYHDRNHHETGVPSLRNVVFVVEDR
jgi:hypothetical protein